MTLMLSPINLKVFNVFFALFFLTCKSQENKNVSILPSERPNQKTNFVYENKFSPDEKLKLENWITTVSEAAQKILGRYPFDIYYYFHRRENSDAAVSFAYTVTSDTLHSAHFMVDPSFSTDQFMNDWMAPHEISHLALPRLAESDLWFYEGFATYMSRQVMEEMGIYSSAEVDSINHKRIAEVKYQFTSSSNLPFVADSLIKNHEYSAVYWIGASYFLVADEKLKAQKKLNCCEVLRDFQRCCHQNKMKIVTIISAFDIISDSDVFSKLYMDYTKSPCKIILHN